MLPTSKQPAKIAMALLLVGAVGLALGSTQQNRASAKFSVFTLDYASPTDVDRMLRELLGDEADKTQVVADTKAKQLLVRGSEDAVQLAMDLIERMDVPPTKPAARQVIQTYKSSSPLVDAERIRKRFGDSVAVTKSTSADAVLVRASESVQQSVGRFMKTPVAENRAIDSVRSDKLKSWFDRTATKNRDTGATATRPADLQETRAIRFRIKTANDIRLQIQKLLGERVSTLQDGRLEFRTRDARAVTLAFRDRPQSCELSGSESLVRQFNSLLTRFDSVSRSGNDRTRFIRVHNVDPRTIQQTIKALKPRAPAYARQGAAFEKATIQLASYQRSPQLPRGAREPQNQLRRPASDLEVEALPDLDVVILRGRDPDIEELTRIIREIERIAEVTAPEIEVYNLQHVRGPALDQLIDQVLDDLTGTLQGRVTITPLIKPNALLLIGWGEAVKAVKELITKLDQPVTAETQLQLFALKNAAATQVRTTIQEFLTDRGGLGPAATITADARTNTLIVHASPRDLDEVEVLVERLDVSSSQSVNRGKMLRLKNALAADVATTVQAALAAARGGTADGRSAALEIMLDGPDGERLLKSGLLDDLRVTADSRTNTLFLTGPPESVAMVEQLIDRLDQSPNSAAQLKVFPIENGDASEMVLVLRTLFPAAAASSTVPQLAASQGETSLVPVRFSVDPRTNTVIATGSPGDLEVVEALIRRLDLKGAQDRINKIYRLENSPATDVAQAVNEFLRSERVVQQAAPGRGNAFQQIESEVVVVPEPVGNSLIISATPRFYEEIIELVKSLDEQPPQVLIQVVLAEVELDNVHEFGVEVGLQDSLLFDRGLLGDLLTTTATTATSTAAGVVTETTEIIQAASLTPGFDFNNNPLGNSGSTLSTGTSGTVAGQALSSFSVGRVNSDLGFGGLVLSASSENVSVLIRALNQSSRFEVLSRPQIMTLDNQPASILVGQRVPRVVGTSITQVGQVNSIELEDVGLILGVTPRISPDGMVVMEVDAEKSEIGRVEDGIPVSVSTEGTVVRSPRVNVTRAQTTVSAASGQTIVIGGLITNGERSITRRVPWLSEIPVLGEMFKYDGFESERRELLIILTPRVIRNRDQAEHLKQLEMARISWSSCDAFDWLGDESEAMHSGAIDDSGIPIIYPDATPGLEWNRQQPTIPPDPPRPPGDLPLPQDPAQGLNPANTLNLDPLVEPSSYEVPARNKSVPGGPRKRKRSLWPFKRRENQ